MNFCFDRTLFFFSFVFLLILAGVTCMIAFTYSRFPEYDEVNIRRVYWQVSYGNGYIVLSNRKQVDEFTNWMRNTSTLRIQSYPATNCNIYIEYKNHKRISIRVPSIGTELNTVQKRSKLPWLVNINGRLTKHAFPSWLVRHYENESAKVISQSELEQIFKSCAGSVGNKPLHDAIN